MSAGVKLRGFEGVEAALRALGDPAAAMKITDAAVAAGARVIRDEARWHVPGARLAKGLISRRKKKATGSHQQVGFHKDKAWWAHFIELGTKPHTTRVPGQRSTGKPKKVMANKARGEVYGKVVHHPGIPAQEILTKAAESEERHVLEVMSRRMRQGIERVAKAAHAAKGGR